MENYKLKALLKKNLKPYLKVDLKIIKFDDAEIDKYKFHQYRSPISINNLDINKTVLFNTVSFSLFECI